MGWKKISSVLAAIILIGGAASAFGIETLRFWATPSEIYTLSDKLTKVSQISYSTAIRILNDRLILVQDRLYSCVNSTPKKDCTHLRQQEFDLLRELEELKRAEGK